MVWCATTADAIADSHNKSQITSAATVLLLLLFSSEDAAGQFCLVQTEEDLRKIVEINVPSRRTGGGGGGGGHNYCSC